MMRFELDLSPTPQTDSTFPPSQSVQPTSIQGGIPCDFLGRGTTAKEFTIDCVPTAIIPPYTRISGGSTEFQI